MRTTDVEGRHAPEREESESGAECGGAFGHVIEPAAGFIAPRCNGKTRARNEHSPYCLDETAQTLQRSL